MDHLVELGIGVLGLAVTFGIITNKVSKIEETVKDLDQDINNLDRLVYDKFVPNKRFEDNMAMIKEDLSELKDSVRLLIKLLNKSGNN